MNPNAPNGGESRPKTPPPPDDKKTNGNANRPNAEPAHHQIQTAHTQYLNDIGAAWNENMLQFQKIQTEFERALERAWQTQDPNAFQQAWADAQQASQDACADPVAAKRAEEALRNYKAALQKAIAGADIDDLNLTDLAHLTQSLAMVSQMAMAMAVPRQGSSATSLTAK